MRYASLVLVFAAALLATLPGAAADISTDSGAASFFPWSGYWWQHAAGGLTTPLSRYDQAFGTQAAAWERKVHVSREIPQWYGHCHAWSAASVSEKEPRGRRVTQQVSFGVGDQKGLLSACHAMDVANVYGDRFGDGVGNDDKQDMNPVEFWRILQMYVKQRKLPIIVDLEPGEEVWNYPVCSYRTNYSPAEGGWYNATLVIMAVDNDVPPDYVGHKSALHRYSFRFRMQDGAAVADGAQWTGRSSNEHPDFAWYPYVAVAENPEIDVARVSQVVGYTIGGNNPPADDGSSIDPPGGQPPPPVADDSRPPEHVSFEDQLSPDELLGLVTNKTSHFNLDIFTEGGDGARFREGDRVRVSAESGAAGFLYLFDIGPQGNIRLVFPLPGDDNRVEANKLLDVPALGHLPWLRAEGAGQHYLKGIVTQSRIRLTGFSAPAPAQPSAASQAQPSQAREPVVPDQKPPAASNDTKPAQEKKKDEKKKRADKKKTKPEEKKPQADKPQAQPAESPEPKTQDQPAEKPQAQPAEPPKNPDQPAEKPQPQPAESPEPKADDQPAQQTREPLTLRLYPTAINEIRDDLLAFFSKGQDFKQEVTDKGGPFAQDRCDYFVLPAPKIKIDDKAPKQTAPGAAQQDSKEQKP